MTKSPFFTSMATRLPSSSRRPGPTVMTSPFLGLLPRRVGEYKAAGRDFLFFGGLDKHSVSQRFKRSCQYESSFGIFRLYKILALKGSECQSVQILTPEMVFRKGEYLLIASLGHTLQPESKNLPERLLERAPGIRPGHGSTQYLLHESHGCVLDPAWIYQR